MKVISTNIGQPTTINWNGQDINTGIFKIPCDEPIYLDVLEVNGDSVIDLRYHGGKDKACYFFGLNHYDFFKNEFPDLDWNYGMFGENVTLDSLNEKEVYVGSQYQLGDAIIEISEHREPCFKLGVRFKNQRVLKRFINHGYCGFYARIIKPGHIQAGDKMKQILEPKSQLSIFDLFDYSMNKRNSKIQNEIKRNEKISDKLKSKLL